jgi:phosphatidate phosphatase APP1
MNLAVLVAGLERRVELRLARLLWRRGWRVRLLAFTSYGVAAPPGQGGWVRLIGRALLTGTPGPEAELVRGWRRFMTIPLVGVAVQVDVGGTTAAVRTGPGGYVDHVLAAGLASGWHDVTMSSAHSEVARGRVRVVGPDETTGLVSDIDDTVIITALPRPLRAFWNTFVRHESTRRPVPGMAELFTSLEPGGGAPFTAYVSTGPWTVAPSVERFLDRHGYPAGPLLMTDWGPSDERWFRSGRQHKTDALRQLLADLPQLTWTLVGDDGQHDPALYDDLVAENPDRVRLVLIRQLSETEQLLTHGTPTALPGEGAGDRPARPDVPVLRARDGHGLAHAVAALDDLDP